MELWIQGLWCQLWWQTPNPVVNTCSKGCCRTKEESGPGWPVELSEELTSTSKPGKLSSTKVLSMVDDILAVDNTSIILLFFKKIFVFLKFVVQLLQNVKVVQTLIIVVQSSSNKVPVWIKFSKKDIYWANTKTWSNFQKMTKTQASYQLSNPKTNKPLSSSLNWTETD